jgi:hypothetical protein
MKCLIFLLPLLLITSATLQYKERVSPLKASEPETFTVDLDLPPVQRWQQVIAAKNESLWIFKSYIESQLPSSFKTIYAVFPEFVAKLYNKEFAEEIAGIAELAKLEYGFTFFLNFMYEMNAYCTSIVAQAEDGTIIHGRNLDYSYPEYIANLSVNVDFYRNGSYLYSGNVIAGYLGILTGKKPNAFSITANQRNLNDSIANTFLEVLEGGLPSIYLVRMALEQDPDYDAAYARLSNTKVLAPVYYILAGVEPNQGVVITRDRQQVNDYYPLDNDEGRWYLVQTNYDRNVPDPANDYRRIPAQEKLAAIGQASISYETLLSGVLAQSPNLNENTILTTITSPGDVSYFNTTLWF